MIWMIFGLGNPGKEYDDTRHNVGFRVVDELAKRWGEPHFERGRHCVYAETGDELEPILLVKPMRYMNRSGLAWAEMVDRYEIDAEEAVVICDDMNLPFGRVRIRTKGTDGGHNGLASILDAVGTENIPRLRIGIGQPETEADWADFVLSPFSEQEQAHVERIISIVADAAQTIVDDGITRAMDQFNNVQIVSE